MKRGTTVENETGLVGELPANCCKLPTIREKYIFVPATTTRGAGTLAVPSVQNKGAAVKMHSAVFGKVYSPMSNRAFTCYCKGSMSLATPAS